jgi:hypothetical protein
MLPLYRRLASLDQARRRLLVEAATLTTLVWAGLHVMPFLVLERWLDRLTAPPIGTWREPSGSRWIDEVNWAVTAVAKRFAPATCLVQALAASVMLRRRGVECELRIGVRNRPDAGPAPIEAHAWLECGGQVAVGDIEYLPELTVMARPGRR